MGEHLGLAERIPVPWLWNRSSGDGCLVLLLSGLLLWLQLHVDLVPTLLLL
jgi:hypothetical protein